MPEVYNWERFWCPREGTFQLSLDGFLQEVSKRYRKYSHVKLFEEISDSRVLILLGEPGIGKTFAIRAERATIESRARTRGELILWPDLQTIGSEEAFRRAIVEDDSFRAWRDGSGSLHLYLDALDECMLRVRHLGRLLVRELESGPIERLTLRLTCRTAEWSNELETDLKRLFNEVDVKAFELLPLTKRDVMTAVRAHGIDTDHFFDYIRNTGAGALASRPVSLDFLIRSHQRNALPSTQRELYERGCEALCEETEHRTESGLPPLLTAAQRLAIAKRVAAAMVFSGSPMILFGRDEGDVPNDVLRIGDIAGGTERANFSIVEVTAAAVKDSLDTGLFTSRGAKLLGWAHHLYQEFLAAKYVSDSGLSAAQLLPLIVHPDDPDRKLTPQLHGVAGWLAALHGEIFDYVAEHEPELLLTSDVVLDRAVDRARIVGELLQRRADRKLARIDVLVLPRLVKFAHPEIVTQLRPFLNDVSTQVDVRRFAADIAEYAGCVDLVPDLTAIALDTTEPLELRVDAASAVARCGTTQQRAALKPLLDGPGNSRSERWLIRQALKASWPHALSAQELFDTLSGERRRLGDISDDFMIVDHVMETITADHLGIALTWVLRRVRSTPEGRATGAGDALQRLEDAIVARAWKAVDDEVIQKLSAIAVEKMQRHEPLVTREDPDEDSEIDFAGDVDSRRRLATAILTEAARTASFRPWLLFDETRYLLGEDLEWLLDRQGRVSQTADEKKLETRVVMSLADLTDPATFERVHSVGSRNDVLAEGLRLRCEAVELDSKEAAEARAEYQASQEVSRRKRPTKKVAPAPDITGWLERTEREIGAFWVLLEQMSVGEDDTGGDLLSLDVRSFPGWHVATDTFRQRVVRLGLRFVNEGEPKAEQWFGTQQFTRSAVGGVRALMLLKNAAPEEFRAVRQEIWRKWVPALLGIPNNDVHVPLLADAYAKAPDEVIERLQQLVRSGSAHIVHKLSDILDERIVEGVLATVQQSELPADDVARILEALLASPPAQRFAQSLMTSASDPALRIVAGASLLMHAPNESWTTLWAAINADRDYGRRVIERAVDRDYFDAKPVHVLEEGRVADLYVWLCAYYPPEDDVLPEGPYTPDTRDKIATWRSRCLNVLKERGTWAACEALRRIAAVLPQQEYLPQLIVEAEANRRARTWQPTPVAALRQLLADKTRRQVRSESELADVVIESLGRLQRKLQGETPIAPHIWNTAPKFTPKSENEFADFVVSHLRDDLGERAVIIGREVEIRRSASPGSGERTDIHVDVALTGGSAAVASVILEAKGCWNQTLMSGIREQLAMRYLRANQTRSGVYLVGSFNCSVWDASDYRKARCPGDVQRLAEVLNEEAAALRSEGFDIRVVILDCTLR